MMFVALLRNSLSAQWGGSGSGGGGEGREQTTRLYLSPEATSRWIRIPLWINNNSAVFLKASPEHILHPTPSIFPRTQCHRRNRVWVHMKLQNSARVTKLLYYRLCALWHVITFLHVAVVSAYSCASSSIFWDVALLWSPCSAVSLHV